MTVEFIPNLYADVYRAHRGISIDPRAIAESMTLRINEDLFMDLKAIPERHRPLYIHGYTFRLQKYLTALGKVCDPLVVGHHRYNNRTNDQWILASQICEQELNEYRTRFIQRVYVAMDKREDKKVQWEMIEMAITTYMHKAIEIDNGISSEVSIAKCVNMVTSIVRKVIAQEDYKAGLRCLDLVDRLNQEARTPVIAADNSVWRLREHCIKNQHNSRSNIIGQHAQL